MNRHLLLLLSVVIVAAIAALGGFLLSGRANAGGSGYGYGHRMMGAYGAQMMGGHRAENGSATLMIRHQRSHCHAWSLNGGPFGASLHVNLEPGSTLSVTNDDVMPHRLVELAGPSVAMHNGSSMPMGARMHGTAAPGLMNHMGATATVKFSKPGVYRFRTRAGEDYMPGMATIGADNVLRLTVTVA
jgi:hypothetical protein